MKIAVCISGQPRNIDRGILNILNFFKFDFDVFSHAWWSKDAYKNEFEETKSDMVDNSWISKMYQNLDVKKILIENQINFNVPEILEKRKLKFTNAFNVCSGLYSIHKCNELKKSYEIENNFKYDFVIRTRYDFGLSEPIYIENFDKNIIYAPSDNSHAYGFNDQFAIGSSENIDIYSDVYLSIKSIIESHNSGIYTANYCNKPDNVGHEQILQRHLENNKIDFKLLDFKNFLFRDKNNRTRIHSIES